MTIRLIPTKRGQKLIDRLNKSNGIKVKKGKTGGKKGEPINLQKELTDAYTKYKKKDSSVDFQSPSAQSLVVYDENINEIFRCTGRIPRKKLNKIASRYPNAIVLVDIGAGLLKQLPIKVFKKLIKIQFIIFQREYEFFGIDEFEQYSKAGEWFAPDNVVEYIFSVNHLIKTFVLEEAFDMANQVYLSAKFYHLTGSEKTCKILYRSGKVVEMSYEEFLEKYKLDIKMPLLQPKSKAKKKQAVEVKSSAKKRSSKKKKKGKKKGNKRK